MAEWAFEASLMQSDLPYEADKIKSYAERSAKAGSLLGKTLHGQHIKLGFHQAVQSVKGQKIINEAAEAGHPYAKFTLACNIFNRIYRNRLVGDVSDDPEVMFKLLEEAKNAEVAATDALEGLIAAVGADGTVDMKEFFDANWRCFRKKSSNVALDSLHYGSVQNNDPTHQFFTPEMHQEIIAVVEKASAKGDPRATFRLRTLGRNMGASYHDPETNFHETVPITLKAIQSGFSYARINLYWSIDHGYRCKGRRWHEVTTSVENMSHEMVTEYDEGLLGDIKYIGKYYSTALVRKLRYTGQPLPEKHVKTHRYFLRRYPSAEAYLQFANDLVITNRQPKNLAVGRRATNFFLLVGESLETFRGICYQYKDGEFCGHPNKPEFLAITHMKIHKYPGRSGRAVKVATSFTRGKWS